MKTETVIKRMIKQGIIKRDNLTHKPRDDIKIKTLKFWYNSTHISKRWDCEIWYEDKSHERLAKISYDSMMLFMQCAYNQN